MGDFEHQPSWRFRALASKVGGPSTFRSNRRAPARPMGCEVVTLVNMRSASPFGHQNWLLWAIAQSVIKRNLQVGFLGPMMSFKSSVAKRIKNLSSTTAAVILLTVSFNVNSQSYKYLDLGTLGGTTSGARGINNSGQIIGYASFTDEVNAPAVLWNGSSISILDTPEGKKASANAINSSGQIVGRIQVEIGQPIFTGGVIHAATWINGVASDLGTLGGTNSNATAINNFGQIVGYSDIAGNLEYHATVWNGKFKTDLGTIGGSYSGATGINDLGQVVGYSYGIGNNLTHAVLWDGTNTTVLSNTRSAATSINSLGQIVGVSTDENGKQRATLWIDGVMKDLGTLGGSESAATGINRRGQVIGYSTTSDELAARVTIWNEGIPADLNDFLDTKTVSEGWMLLVISGVGRASINDNGVISGTAYNIITGESHAYSLTPSPVPLPGTLFLMLSGIGTFGIMISKRKQSPY
jgi:probable HAF family extracellular repeat protein